MLLIDVTCEVSNLVALIYFNEEQLLNIELIDLTCEVSKLDTSIEVNDEQPLNK